MESLLFLLPVFVVGVVLWFTVRPLLKMRNMGKQMLKTGAPELATVVAVEQTGMIVNGVNQMRVVLDLQQAGAPARRVTTKQLLPLGTIPSKGQVVYVLVDQQNPDNVMFAGMPAQQYASAYGPPTPQPGQQTEQQRMELMAISPHLREHGELAVATILAIRPQQPPSVTFDLEIDAIGEPRRKVSATQAMFGEPYKLGERIYLLVDPQHRDSVALVPLSAIGNQHLPQGMNRLDALVLGPQILTKGAKATGTIQSATQIPINTPALVEQGYSRFHLSVHIIPDDGSAPYDAEQDISFSTPEKAARLGTVGNTVPIRYDPADPKSFVTDSVALGYPNPYEAARQAMQASLGKTT